MVWNASAKCYLYHVFNCCFISKLNSLSKIIISIKIGHQNILNHVNVDKRDNDILFTSLCNYPRPYRISWCSDIRAFSLPQRSSKEGQDSSQASSHFQAFFTSIKIRPTCKMSIWPRSHRSIRYTVFAIRFALRHRRHSSDVAWK